MPNASQPVGVEPLRLDDCDSDISVEPFVVSKVDALAAAFAQEALYLVAAAGEGSGERWGGLWRGCAGMRCGYGGPAAIAELRLSRQLPLAARASGGKPTATLEAKPSILTILVAARWAEHCSPQS
jgi:hypothetical protein